MIDVDFIERWAHLPRGEYAFPGPLRDRLVGAIVAGAKTTTTSLAVEYESAGQRWPAPGDREAVIDSAGLPVVVTENTAIRLLRLADVDLRHARDEGEDFVTVEEWRTAHEAFWQSEEFRAEIGEPGFAVTDATEVVCVRFRVIDVVDHR